MTEEPLDHQEFRLNMRRARRHGSPWAKIETYNRRFGDDRPAVRARDDIELQAVIRTTPVLLEWDTLGEGYIVYPAVRA